MIDRSFASAFSLLALGVMVTPEPAAACSPEPKVLVVSPVGLAQGDEGSTASLALLSMLALLGRRRSGVAKRAACTRGNKR
ncbi:MAG: MYXO-CTERM sorting domain-containing protein [Myxococcales bacterium]